MTLKPKVWDARAPHSTLTIPGHDFEILACDWSKYNDAVLATGSVDKSVRIWDTRAPGQPLQTLQGHSYAVRRIKFSPWQENLIYSCSYDMTVCMWDVTQPMGPVRWI